MDSSLSIAKDDIGTVGKLFFCFDIDTNFLIVVRVGHFSLNVASSSPLMQIMQTLQ